MATESILKDSALLLSFFEQNTLPIAIADMNLIIVEANQAALQLLGTTAIRLVGKSMFELTNKGSIVFDVNRFEKLKSGEISSYSVKRTYQNEEGAKVKGTITVSLFDHNGERCVAGIFQEKSEESTSFDVNSFDFLSSILSSSPDMHYFLDVGKRKHIYENKSIIEYLGYTKKDLRSKREVDFLQTLVDRSSIAHYGENFRVDQIKGKSAFTEAEYKIKCKDGSWKWFRERATPIKFDAQKRAAISYGILQDITEKREFYNKVIEQQTFIEKVADTVPDVIYVYTIDPLDIVYSNFKSSTFLGYTEKEWSELRLKNVHPDFTQKMKDQLADLLSANNDASVSSDVQYRHKNGSYRWLLNKSRVFKRDEEGSPTQILSIATDIHDYKDTLDQLRESEETKGAILHAIPELLLKFSKEGVCTEIISGVIDNRYELPKKLVGMHFKEILPKRNAEKIMTNLVNCIETKSIAAFELKRVRKETTFNFECRFSALNNNEAILMIRDISPRKKMESALDQKMAELSVKNKQLELYIQKNTELERFAYIVSHDLKEPIRTVKAFSDILNKNYREGFDENAKTYVDYITSGIDRMNSLVEGILNFSRIDSQGSKFTKVDMNVVLEKVIKDLHVVIEEKKAVITFDELPKTTMCDELQIRQLLQNLISNAIKFTKDLTPEIKIKCKKKGDFWEFSIQDNGIGIQSAQLKNIFAIFKRLHTQKEFSGQGIGLSICKKIVERHGGAIKITSKFAKGTNVFFTLPV